MIAEDRRFLFSMILLLMSLVTAEFGADTEHAHTFAIIQALGAIWMKLP